MASGVLTSIGRVLAGVGLKRAAVKYGLYNPLGIACLNVINRRRWRHVDITMLLWPPAQHLFDRIQAAVAETCTVLDTTDVELREDDFDEFVYRLYAIDFAGDRKIRPKLPRLKRDDLRIRTLRIRIPHPNLIAQDLLNRVRCREINALKDGLRQRFRHEIEDYTYDVIMHSTEVDYQNAEVMALIENYRVAPNP